LIAEKLTFTPLCILYRFANREHATCAACFISTKVCEVCKMATIPSPVLEQLRTSLPISCKYRKNGCQTVLTLDSLVYHEIDCEWRLIFCPDLSCNTEPVIFNTLDQHLTENHKTSVITTKQQRSAISLFLPASTRSVPPGIHFALLLLLLVLLGRPLIKLGTFSADS
jgi:hypothetical protein